MNCTGFALRLRMPSGWIVPAKAKLTAPAIQHLQEPADFQPTGAIPFEPGRGWLLTAGE